MAKTKFTMPEKKERAGNIYDMFNDTNGIDGIIKTVNIYDLRPNENNPYPIAEIPQLADDIMQNGLQQNLVVLEQLDGTYIIISGHRRYHAIKYVLFEDDDGDYKHLESVPCKVYPHDTDPLLIRWLLHTTNVNVRSYSNMSGEEKTVVLTECIDIAKKLRNEGEKGRTREIVCKMLGVSEATAGRDMKKLVSNDTETKKQQQPEPRIKVIRELKLLITKLDNINSNYAELRNDSEISDLYQELSSLIND